MNNELEVPQIHVLPPSACSWKSMKQWNHTTQTDLP